MESAWRQRSPDLEFDAYVLAACADPSERHVVPQSQCCSRNGEWLPTHVIRWDFEELAEILEIESTPHENKSVPRPFQWSDEARELFDRVYAADLELWAEQRLTKVATEIATEQ
jgi:hypothetical protein